MKGSNFIGKQISRFKIGLVYLTTITSTITAVSVFKIALNLPDWLLFALLPFFILMGFGLGYFFDKTDIITSDYRKSIEMSHRQLNTQDKKQQYFYLALFDFIIDSFLQAPEELKKELRKKYKEYQKKKDWI